MARSTPQDRAPVEVQPRPRTEVRPERPRSGKTFRGHALLAAGVLVGLLGGSIGWGWVNAAGKKIKPAHQEELYLEYRVDPKNGYVSWADITSAPDTFLVLRLQSEPEKVYVTPVVQDDPGFPRPQHVTVPRAFLEGEKAYVYLMDDDSLSNKLWRELARSALRKGGAAVGRVAGVWTLGQAPSDQMVQFANEAGDRIGTLTLDANDCLAWSAFALHSQELRFDAQDEAASALELLDRKGGVAGTLSVLYGHSAAGRR